MYSPLIVHTTPEHAELKEIAHGCITKHHSYHYLGFAATQWKLFAKESPRRVKPLLYASRVLLTGIHLMRTGEIEANLERLNDEFRLEFLPDLIDRKRTGVEKQVLEDAAFEFHKRKFAELESELRRASERSHLPAGPSARKALNDLLVRVRLAAGCES